MPSLTVQCGRNLSLASFCFFASCSGESFDLSGNSTSPCQPVRSLPLKSSLNPSGGLLSSGKAFSSSARRDGFRTKRPAKPMRANELFMFIRAPLFIGWFFNVEYREVMGVKKQDFSPSNFCRGVSRIRTTYDNPGVPDDSLNLGPLELGLLVE